MKAKTELLTPMLALVLFVSVNPLRAQPTASATNRLDREEIRRQLESMTPEERRAKIRELRAAFGGEAGGQADGTITERRRAELRERFEDLQRKEADGSITPEEKKQLDRLEMAIKRFAERPGDRPEGAPVPRELPQGRRPMLGAMPGGFPGGQPGQFTPMFDRVLTEDQRASLREAMQAGREPMRELEEKLRDARQEIFQAGLGKDFNEDALREKALAVGKLEAELTVLRARAFAKMKPPLSERQIEQLKNPPPFAADAPRPEFRRDEPRRGDRPQRPPRDEHNLPPPPKPEQ